jgi:hypothetical protein
LARFQAVEQLPNLAQQLRNQPTLAQGQHRPAQIVARVKGPLQVLPTAVLHGLLHLGFGHG